MRTSISFDNVGDFEATRAAESWLKNRGFAIGSMQGDEPRAIWHDACYISKWRGLSVAERREMHAFLEGDGRAGPVKIWLCRAATSEAREAFNCDPETVAAAPEGPTA